MPIIKPITDLRNTIDKAIFEAEREIAEGAELLDAREALEELRKKHFG